MFIGSNAWNMFFGADTLNMSFVSHIRNMIIGLSAVRFFLVGESRPPEL